MTSGQASETCDRHDVTDEIEIELVVDRRANCVRRGDQKERIAIQVRANDRLGGDDEFSYTVA
jgi:hypothetical protein